MASLVIPMQSMSGVRIVQKPRGQELQADVEMTELQMKTTVGAILMNITDEKFAAWMKEYGLEHMLATEATT